MNILFRKDVNNPLRAVFASTLAAAVNVGNTSFTLATGDGDGLPVMASGDVLFLSLGTDELFEETTCIARSGDVLTCNPLVRAWPIGTPVHANCAAEIFEGLQRTMGARVPTNILSLQNFYYDTCGAGYFISETNEFGTVSSALTLFSRQFQNRAAINTVDVILSFATEIIAGSTVTVALAPGGSSSHLFTSNHLGFHKITVIPSAQIQITENYQITVSIDGAGIIDSGEWRVAAVVVS